MNRALRCLARERGKRGVGRLAIGRFPGNEKGSPAFEYRAIAKLEFDGDDQRCDDERSAHRAQSTAGDRKMRMLPEQRRSEGIREVR